MSAIYWILYSFIAVFTALYIVGFCKKIVLLANISSVFIIPLIGALNLLFLKNQLPDSFHIIVISSITFFFVIIAQVFFIFENKRILTLCARICYAISMAVWINLYYSAFYIYRISGVTITIFAIIFLVISAITCILAGKQKFHTYTYPVIGILLSGFLALLSFVFIINKKTTSTILLFAGAIINTALVVFYFLDINKFKFKLGKPVKLVLLVAAQTLISFSNVLMLR